MEPEVRVRVILNKKLLGNEKNISQRAYFVPWQLFWCADPSVILACCYVFLMVDLIDDNIFHFSAEAGSSRNSYSSPNIRYLCTIA
jgi:hypothetical protein